MEVTLDNVAKITAQQWLEIAETIEPYKGINRGHNLIFDYLDIDVAGTSLLYNDEEEEDENGEDLISRIESNFYFKPIAQLGWDKYEAGYKVDVDLVYYQGKPLFIAQRGCLYSLDSDDKLVHVYDRFLYQSIIKEIISKYIMPELTRLIDVQSNITIPSSAVLPE